MNKMASIARKFGIRKTIVDIKNYSINTSKVLGQGAFGIVFKGKDVKKNLIAAKRIDSKRHPKVLAYNYARLLEVDHQNIVKVLNVEIDNGILWLFMEFCEFGDLNTFYRTRNVMMETSSNVMKQIMSGIAYLHNRGIKHRDVKPGNILVESEQPVVVKLTDFDVTKYLDPEIETSLMTSNVGTNVFKAPEYFRRNELKKIMYHRNVDIYAAGLTFLAILQHKKEDTVLIPRIETPQDGSELHMPIGQLIAERIKYNIKELDVITLNESVLSDDNGNISNVNIWKEEMKKLIQKMTCHKPEDRLSASETLQVTVVFRFIL